MANRDHDRNDEIVGLLNIIGKRLIDSEQERDSLKAILESQQDTLSGLQEKTEESEKIYLDLKGRLARREEADDKMAKKQRDLEDTIDEWQSEYSQKIEKALTVAEHIEEVMAQQNRLFRRIDQMTQDRARVTRKLERIEDTVMETKDALEARAMVLLTDSQTAEDSDKPHVAANAHARQKPFKKSLRPVDGHDGQPAAPEGLLWRYPQRARAAIMTILLGTAFAGGLAVTKVEPLTWPATDRPAALSSQQTAAGQQDMAALTGETAPKKAEMPPERPESPAKNAGNSAAEESESAATDDAPVLAAANPADEKNGTADKVPDNAGTDNAETAADDSLPQTPFYRDEQAMRTAMAEDPDKLGAALNAIEPVAAHTTAPDEPEAVAEDKKDMRADAAKIQPAALTSATQQIAAESDNIEEFVKNAYRNRPSIEKTGADPDLPAVVREIEKRAFEGVPEAQHDLAAIYTAGHGGVEIDYEKAVFWFTEAAYNGIGNARYNLGVLHHQGLGVGQDTDEAISWYKAAAAVGHPEAQYNLGIAHIEGIGTAYDPQKAAAYFEQAALSGIPEAAYNLGIVHENALTTDARPEEALYWYKKAADAGSSEAKTALTQLSRKLGIDPQKVDDILSDLETLDDKAPEDNNEAAARPQNDDRKKITSLEAGGTLDAHDLLGPDGQPIEKALARHQVSNETLQDSVATDQTRSTQIAAADTGAGNVNIEEETATEDEDRTINAAQAVTAQIQEQLVYLGLYPGPADGIITPLTKDAIRTYQSLYGLDVTGAPSEALLAHILMGTEEGGYGNANIAEQDSFRDRQTEMGSRAE